MLFGPEDLPIYSPSINYQLSTFSISEPRTVLSCSRQTLKTFCFMKTQISQSAPKPSFQKFQSLKIKNGKLIHIKGGDGDTPPDDGVIGVEEIIGA
jgi:hypothetical protein